MTYRNEKESLLAQIRERYGISLAVSDESDEDKVLEGLHKIAASGEKEEISAGKSEALQYLERRVTPSDATRIYHGLTVSRAGKHVIVCLLSFAQELTAEVSDILADLTEDEDILIRCDKRHMVLLRFGDNYGEEDATSVSAAITDTLAADAMIAVFASVDLCINEEKALPRAYANVRLGMQLGRRLYPSDHVFLYRRLGMGKLLHAVPDEAREEFFRDFLGSFRFSSLTQELCSTVQTFFETDLSVTEAAKRLFIHRNTLIYRLDKFEKQTGLDPRRFDDAVVCRLAMQMEQLCETNS